MTKRIRHRSVLTLQLEDCTLDEMLKHLNECKEKHPDVDLLISYEGEYMEYNGPDEMQIHYYSEETDAEYNTRLDYETAKQTDKELKEMDRLLSYKKLNPVNQQRLDELLEKYHNG